MEEDYLHGRTGITIEILDDDQKLNEHSFDIILEDDETYHVLHELEDLGTLKHVSGEWKWIEGSLSQQYADEIGKAIEAIDSNSQ